MCPGENPKHFTEFVISSIISSSSPRFGLREQGEYQEVSHLYSVSQLEEAGIKFKVSPNNCILDLELSEDGVLSMPILNISSSTQLYFRNMMAYEHCHDSATKIITQYVAILDFLINTEKDVNILVDKKIIVNWLGDTDKVVTMISNLNSTVTMPEFCSHYFSVCNGLNKFYENPRNKYKAMLIHDYLNTPWKIASTVAAIVLLLLTLIQTVCSIISLVQK